MKRNILIAVAILCVLALAAFFITPFTPFKQAKVITSPTQSLECEEIKPIDNKLLADDV